MALRLRWILENHMKTSPNNAILTHFLKEQTPNPRGSVAGVDSRFSGLIDISRVRFILPPSNAPGTRQSRARIAVFSQFALRRRRGVPRALGSAANGFSRWHSSAVERHIGNVEVLGSSPSASFVNSVEHSFGR